MSPDAVRAQLGPATLYLVRKPWHAAPVLTREIPCGPTVAVSLGRYAPDSLPTLGELRADLLSARQELARQWAAR